VSNACRNGAEQLDAVPGLGEDAEEFSPLFTASTAALKSCAAVSRMRDGLRLERLGLGRNSAPVMPGIM